VAQSTPKITKRERARLRQLAGQAWEAELETELETLFEDFCQWADKGMSAFELRRKLRIQMATSCWVT
jgi:hypothetical protein